MEAGDTSLENVLQSLMQARRHVLGYCMQSLHASLNKLASYLKKEKELDNLWSYCARKVQNFFKGGLWSYAAPKWLDSWLKFKLL